MFKTLATVCEIILLVCFGASWPFNVIKAYKARTTKGTSLPFMSLIDFGYVMGILKMVFTFMDKNGLDATQWVAFACYIINLALVTTGIVIYFRNKGLDKKAAEEKAA